METCENCGKVIGLKETACLYNTRVVCEMCHGALVAPPSAIVTKTRAEAVTANPVVPTGVYTGPQCLLCGHPMVKMAVGTHPFIHAIVRVFLFLVGLFVIVEFQGIFILFGGILVVYSLITGSNRRKILMCRNCGSFADRR